MPKESKARILTFGGPPISAVFFLSPDKAAQLKPHPLALLFPPLTVDEIDALASNISGHGQTHPVILLDDMILDGVHRVKACIEHQPRIDVKCVRFEDLKYKGTPEEFVWSENSVRRHLEEGQIVAIEKKLFHYDLDEVRAKQAEAGKAGAEFGRSGGRGHKKPPEQKPAQGVSAPLKREPQTRDKLAEKAGTSRYKAEQMLKVDKYAPELSEQVAQGTLKLKDATKVAEERRQKSNTSKPRKKRNPWNENDVLTAIEDKVRRQLKHVCRSDQSYFIEKLIQRLSKLCDLK